MKNKVADLVFHALSGFADDVSKKMAGLASGQPEDQLRGPFEVLLGEIGHAIGRSVVAKGESKLPGRLGRPDFAVLSDQLLAGYVELKAPGAGARPNKFKGHDRRQWQRFQALPNLLYCDGNEWGLYRSGSEVRGVVSLAGDVTTAGSSAVTYDDALALQPLLTDFLFWEPSVPSDPKQLADYIAPLCRLLRDDVTDTLRASQSSLVQLALDWRQLLFPDASDEQFADAYAQTIIFGLLLARSEGGGTLDVGTAVKSLAARHTLLSRALEVLTDPQVREELGPALRLAQRVIDRVPIDTLTVGKKDPWLYFYEDFLAAYDPELRKDAGAYYTPVEVVRSQVRLVDELLTTRFGMAHGFAEQEVITLDPAVGTGTYLLGVIDHALRKVEQSEGPGAVPGRASILAANLCGFEIMVGPYSVTELRLTRALRDQGATLPEGAPKVYLTDTLESPHTKPPQLPLFLRPMSDQHKHALNVKESVPVLVCIGNPPYDRHERADSTNKGRTGSWVRWGDPDSADPPILDAFLVPAKEAGHGGDLKNLYNLYVYFWRWALWKVFEHKTASGPGIVSFITAASYLDGDAFVGIREHMRRLCDEIWIIDLGGEGRGTRKTENVFNIQTPVAVAVAARYGEPQPNTPARVCYSRIEGTRGQKLKKLETVHVLSDLSWHECPTGWQDLFRPAGLGPFFEWPLLLDLFPWQHSGVQLKRTWPIAPDRQTLERRWAALLTAADRAGAFRETEDRMIGRTYRTLLNPAGSPKPIALLDEEAPVPPIVRYSFRSFDRQFVLADGRLISRPRPPLWEVHSTKQMYLSTLLSHPLGRGPALMACADIPDLHHFRGSYGAKEVIPLWRDAAGTEPNLAPGLLEMLSKTLGCQIAVEDFVGYVYGLLAHPAFEARFTKELDTGELRVPITKDSDLFFEVRNVGQKLLWLQTYGERCPPGKMRAGEVPQGSARCLKSVSNDAKNYPDQFTHNARTSQLTVGDGVFGPVDQAVWKFEVSGLQVVSSWLGYRMRDKKGRHSSPLDQIHPLRWGAEFTTELLKLLWILEATIVESPYQQRLLEMVVQGPTFTHGELPKVPDSARTLPGPDHGQEVL